MKKPTRPRASRKMRSVTTWCVIYPDGKPMTQWAYITFTGTIPLAIQVFTSRKNAELVIAYHGMIGKWKARPFATITERRP